MAVTSEAKKVSQLKEKSKLVEFMKRRRRVYRKFLLVYILSIPIFGFAGGLGIVSVLIGGMTYFQYFTMWITGSIAVILCLLYSLRYFDVKWLGE